jgi:hypothetical protein
VHGRTYVVATESLVDIARLDDGKAVLALDLVLLAKLDSLVVAPRGPELGVVGSSTGSLVESPLVLYKD